MIVRYGRAEVLHTPCSQNENQPESLTMPGIMNNSYAASRQMGGMKRSFAASKGLSSSVYTDSSSKQQSRRSSIDSTNSSTDYQRRSSIDSAFASLSLQEPSFEAEWGHFVDM